MFLMNHKQVVRIQSFPNFVGLDMGNDIGLRTLSKTGLSEILLGSLSRCFLSISRLSFSTFSNCTLASCLVSKTSKYNIPSTGSKKATNRHAANHPITVSQSCLRGRGATTYIGGIGKSLEDTLVFLLGGAPPLCVAMSLHPASFLLCPVLP